jgi:Peptidase family M23
MSSKTPTYTGLRLGIAVATATLAAVAAGASGAGAQPSLTGFGVTQSELVVTQTLAPQHVVRTSESYGWPVKPFNRQHPVRSFFNDPRIGSGGSHAFHFGIDVSAPDGTPVYAVEAGTVFLDSGRAVAVVAPDRSHSFGYWHIVPAVKSHVFVRQHQLVGWIDKGWEHVHFAERRGGHYVNPLRPGALTPYADRVAPSVASAQIAPAATGALGVTVDAFDTPSLRVPGAWADLPVTPVLIQYRLGRAGRSGAWQTAVDFRHTLLDQKQFGSVYAPATRQNHKGEPGRYVFWLTRAWQPTTGAYVLEIRATDTAGNVAHARLALTVSS